jgi:thioredoxin-dependent peroxiredoxin
MPESKSIQVGQIAPDFTAVVQFQDRLETITLSKLLSSGQKVLLIFYPGDNTPGCTTQLCKVRDIYTDYQNRNVTVLGVNQGSAQSHLDFIQKQNYPFGIVVDESKSIRESYGAIGSFFGKPTTRRSVFLIDTDGKVIFRFFGQQDNDKILKLLDEQD